MIRVCLSERDPRTLADWAWFIGVSYTSLRESCRVLHIPPNDARDFARVLRGIIQARRLGCGIEAVLDVSDTRTLDKLLERAGLDSTGGEVSLEQFFTRQQFVDGNHQGVRVLRRLLSEHFDVR